MYCIMFKRHFQLVKFNSHVLGNEKLQIYSLHQDKHTCTQVMHMSCLQVHVCQRLLILCAFLESVCVKMTIKISSSSSSAPSTSCPVVFPTESCWRQHAALPTPSRTMGSKRGTEWPFTCRCHRWRWRPCWRVPGSVQCTWWCLPVSAQRLWQGGSRMVSPPPPCSLCSFSYSLQHSQSVSGAAPSGH